MNYKEIDVSSINSAAKMSEISKEIEEIDKKTFENEMRRTNALEQTAKNTGEVNNRLNTIIDQQADHIELLKKQLISQEEQIKILNQQKEIISTIFASNSNSEIYEKELLDLLCKEINDKKPAKDFAKSVAENTIANIASSTYPLLFNVVKNFLIRYGILK